MADLSIVASLLKDTNKKLDKLHSDNEQNDTTGDIIKDSLPGILNDKRQSDRQIAQWEKEDARDKATDILIKDKEGKAAKREETTQKIFTDISKPLKTLGLAIPKSGFNAFSEKASAISADSAEKALPSDFKLILQALTPKALMGGFKVGLGDMFKELGSGIKKIGGGMKSLATKGLTAAQRKSEKKEKENKEKKKDGFFKKTFGSFGKLLGGILKTAQLAGKAGFLALAGAGALFALAKLIESPYWLKVAGIVEYGLNQIANLFKLMDEQLGLGGVIATALALYFGPKAAIVLASMAIKKLALMFLGKLGLTAATKGAAGALSGTAGKGGLLKALGRLGAVGGVAFLAAAAVYGVIKAMQALAARDAKNESKRIKDVVGDASKLTKEEATKKLARLTAIEARRRGSGRNVMAPGVNQRLKEESDIQRKKLIARLAELDKEKPPLAFGSTPKQMAKPLAQAFDDAINKTKFEGSAKDRTAQIKKLSDNVFLEFIKSNEFKNLPFLKTKKEALEVFKKTEYMKMQGLISGGLSPARIVGKGFQDPKQLEDVGQKLLMEQSTLRKRQIKDPTRFDPDGRRFDSVGSNAVKLSDELRKHTEALRKAAALLADAKNGGKGVTNITSSNVAGPTHNSTTVAPQIPIFIHPNMGHRMHDYFGF